MEYKVREVREAKGIKPYDLAINVGVSVEILNAIEKGKIKILSVETLFSLATALGVPTSHILRP